MDPAEFARRLDELRDRIRDELRSDTIPRLDQDVDETPDLELGPAERVPLPGEPNLNSTEHLQRANELAVITAPVELRSGHPLLGPLLNLARRVMRPLVQPFIDPYIDRQERFNAEITRHLNELGGRLEARLEAVYAALMGETGDPDRLEARLESALANYDDALRTRQTVLFDALEEELFATRNALADAGANAGAALHAFEVRFVERAQAVDRRFEEKDVAVERLAADLAEARSTLSEVASDLEGMAALPQAEELMQTRTLLAEVLEKARATPRDDVSTPGRRPTTPDDAPDGALVALDGPLWRRLRAWMADEDYRAFQQQFRGQPEEIGARMRAHLVHFADAPGPIADLGCGRGEFLELLEASGHEAIGVEINEADVAECTERGLDAVHADLFEWLEGREEGSLGGIFLAQVIEHVAPPDWTRVLRLALTRLAPDGVVVVETINPQSLFAMVRAYVLDPTHVRPVHPGLLSFLATRVGFGDVQVHFQAAVPDRARPLPVDESKAGDHAALRAVVADFNDRLERIDALCCQGQEYALVGRRGSAGT